MTSKSRYVIHLKPVHFNIKAQEVIRWVNPLQRACLAQVVLHHNPIRVSGPSGLPTFEVVLVSEAQVDLVAVAARALAALGDAGAEAGHAAALHSEVARWTAVWQRGQRR